MGKAWKELRAEQANAVRAVLEGEVTDLGGWGLPIRLIGQMTVEEYHDALDAALAELEGQPRFALIESFGLIPSLITFDTEEARETYIRELILREDTGSLDSWLYATGEGNFDEHEAPPDDADDEEKLTWLLGHGTLLDGNKWELRTEEVE